MHILKWAAKVTFYPSAIEMLKAKRFGIGTHLNETEHDSCVFIAMLIKPSCSLVAAVIAAMLSGVGVSIYYRVRLAHAHAEAAAVRERHALDLKAISDATLAAERKAAENRQAAAQRIEALDAQLTKERQAHETDSHRYRAALAVGAERLRVAVANYPTRGDDLSGTAGTASVGDGATAYADLDAAVAERVFAVAADDQREIDKLRALQRYVCAVRSETAGCK
ncbi:lysis system i-spanin subunit Rz [Burkholderia sp. b13]|uniref:lysis system i-spanin subunit Rz n=2 Tax=Burkholderiaceae TaxID=119060 RepID=UPI00095D3BE7|nr:Bacteriophage Rz lysis protein [Burkholderia sp. b13]SIT75785.1 Bacteriophage Rz lysis protein [Burkholderia sp. b13]